MADLGQYDPIFEAAGAEWNVDPRLLKAMATQESGGDRRAQSKAGAQGLMQIIPETQKYLGVTDPHDPVQSIYGGAKYMAEALDAEKTPEDALRYYHGGKGWRDSYGPESKAYVPAVTAHYVRLGRGVAARTGGTDVAGSGGPSAAAESDPFGAALEAAKSGKPQTAPAETSGGDAFSVALEAAKAKPTTTFGAEPPASAKAADWGIPGPPSASTPHPLAPSFTVGERVGNWIGDTVKGVGNAVTGAYKSSSDMLTPDAQAAVEGVPVVGPVLGAAARVPGAVLGGAGALFAGTQAGVAAAGDTISPGLGRDLAAGLAVIPAVQATHPLMPPETAGIVRARMADNARYTAAPLSAEFKASPLSPEFAARQAANGNAPSGFRAVGADATQGAPMPKTRAEALSDLQKSVTQSAEDRAGPGMKDDTAYLPNIPPRRLAAREFTPANALDEKNMRGSDTAFRADLEKIDRDRNDGMVDTLRTDAGDPNSLEVAHEAREGVAPPAIRLFEGEQPVDAGGLVAHIDGLLAGPAGKRGAVERVLKDVREKLYDPKTGELETLPSQLYGARQNITDLLKKGAKGTGDIAGDAKLAKGVLDDLLPVIDPVITSGAPKFQAYLKDFTEASKPIDQQEFLQNYMTGSKKITDRDGRLLLNKVQKMLDDIYQGQAARGVNKAKSLTEAQIQNVVAVRNELAAQALQDRMASVKGSDTFQQVNRSGVLGEGPLGMAVKGMADVAVQTGLAATTGGVGNLLYQFGYKPALAARAQRKAAAATTARKAQLLDQGPRHPLTPP